MNGLTELSRRSPHTPAPQAADSVAELEAFAPRISAALWEVSEGRRDVRHAVTLDERAAGHRRLQAAESEAAKLLKAIRAL